MKSFKFQVSSFKLSAAVLLFTAHCLLLSCGNGWPNTLRGLLAASPVFFDSLQLGSNRAAVVQDFTDLSNDVITLDSDLKACAADKPCKVNAIDRFQTSFWDVLRRGHFKLSPKLDRVQRAIQGVIDAARIFYGGPAPKAARVRGAENGPAIPDLKASLAELHDALQP